MNRAVDGYPCILFVDDEEMTRKTFERIASPEFPVILASDVAEAIEVLNQRGGDIGVLLTDQRMPGGLGVELLEYAREHNPGIVRMLTTAYSDLEDAIAAVNRGEIIRYIEKPWTNIDALLIDLRVAMRFHQLEQANSELMAEKMSAKGRGARIERLQVLTALAASQPNPSVALIALENMLKAISELNIIYAEDVSTRPIANFGPVTEAQNAILIATQLNAGVSAISGGWQSIANLSISSKQTEERFSHSLVGKEEELISRLLNLFEGTPDLVIEDVAKGIRLSCVISENQNKELARWINVGSDEKSINAITDLLWIYLTLYSSNAAIKIEFDDLGALISVDVLFYESGKKVDLPTQDGDWLEDILILFT